MTEVPTKAKYEKTRHDLRCICRGTPLLAKYGMNQHGEPYIHVKVYKQGKVYGEMIATGGVVALHCRNCFRWNRVVILSRGQRAVSAKLEETVAPPGADENTHGQSLRDTAPSP